MLKLKTFAVFGQRTLCPYIDAISPFATTSTRVPCYFNALYCILQLPIRQLFIKHILKFLFNYLGLILSFV